MEPVKSSLTTSLQAEAATEQKFEAARKLVARRLNLQTKIRHGTLSRAEFERLPADFKAWYKQNHGVPVSAAELQAKQRQLAQRRKNAKAAKKARKVNRQRSR